MKTPSVMMWKAPKVNNLLKACILDVTVSTEGAWEGATASSSKLIRDSLSNWNKCIEMMKSKGGLIVNVCIASVIVTVYWG